MPRQCASCIFREDGRGVALAPGRLDEIRAYLIGGTPHLCHTPQLRGAGTSLACRGGRDWQLEIWYRLGIIEAPTDEALARAYREAMGPDLP